MIPRNLKEPWLRTTAVAALAAALSLFTAVPSYAQDTADEAAAEDEDIIVVTGSRIRRPELEALQPTVTLDAGFADRRGYFDVADAINDLPGVVGSVSDVGNQSAFGAGAQFVNLFGLGSQRTLTLVNGRRFVSSNQASLFSAGAPGIQVDLSVIPSVVIERTELISVGGAPVYGSDAVAGTVNVILKEDFEGVQGDAQFQTREEGNGEQFRLRGLWGSNADNGRGNAFLGMEYTFQEGLLEAELPGPARDCFTGAPNPSPPPTGITVCDRTIPVLTRGGVVPLSSFVDLVQFTPDGQLVPVEIGDPLADLTVVGGGDGLRLRNVTSALTDQERFLAIGGAHYDIVPNYLTWYTELNVADTESTEVANQPFFNFIGFGGESGSLNMPLDNPFLTDQARDVLLDAGYTDSFPIIGRAGSDLLANAPNTTSQFLWRVVTGFKGDFDFADRNFHWDVAFNYGQVELTNVIPRVLDLNFLLALDAVVATQADADFAAEQGYVPGGEPIEAGDIICRVQREGEAPTQDGALNAPDFGSGLGNFEITKDAIGNCVPVNLFGFGAPSSAAIDYVTGNFISTAKNEQVDVVGYITGDVFELPAGMVQFGAGFEYRIERASFGSDAAGEEGLSSSAPFIGSAGSYNTLEGYGEGLVPVFSPDMNIPLLHKLEFEGSVRYIENSRAGGSLIWTAGGRWAPVEDIEFRGNRTRSIRAPSTLELFLGSQPAFSTAADPCDITNIDSGPDPVTRRANCEAAVAAAGLPANFLDTFVSDVTLFTTSGSLEGNPELNNEVANAYTFGAVIQPRWVSGLTFAVDYVNIRIRDAIDTLSLTQQMQLCYDQSSFPNEFCGTFIRDDAFQVIDFTTGFLNVASISYQAIQGQARYQFDVSDAVELAGGGSGDYGSVELAGNFLYLLESDQRDSPLSPLTKTIDEIGDPRYRFQLNFNYFFRDFDFLLQTIYLDDQIFDETLGPEDRDILEVDSYVLFNASVGYQLTDTVRVQATVENLLDVDPSFPLSGFASGGMDILGRRITGRVTAKF